MGNAGSKRAKSCVCGCVVCQKRRAHPQELQDDSHKAQTTSWLPPRENWTGSSGLPYGWETGQDKNDKDYFINHVERYTTREDPRQDPDYVEPPEPREVELVRDLEKGFGFVAGSEKPVVVRFVTEGGPSEDKLLAGDQILKINGEEVRRAPREKVIELVRSCKESIILTVCQPYADNSNRKSALLTAAKKAKLKNNPSRVRFADAVMVNGASVTNPSPVESYVPFMPNVLKVFLENGQTKSFKYDNKTTVRDVMVSLQEKLNLTCVHHFSLVLQNMKNNSGTAAKMTLLQHHETLAEIAARQGARYFRCLFRVTFVPKDAYDLLKEDPVAFEYFYLQCCNDVIHERFASEMKYDTALRLAALHIQQHAITNNMAAKFSIKAVIRDCGLDKFVSKSLLESMKGKELKRMLGQYLKMNQSLAAPGQKQLTALQAKLHYLKIVGRLKTFGSRVFMVTLLDKKTEAMLLVGPQSGISIVTNIKSYTLTQLADFEELEQVRVTRDGEGMQRVDLKLRSPRQEEGVSLGLLAEDAHNLVCLLAGYFAIFVDPDRRLVERTMGKNTSDPDVPTYESVHRVQTAAWSYPEDLVSQVVVGEEDGVVTDNQHLVDLSQDPPEYVDSEQYLSRVKQDLGIQTSQQSADAGTMTSTPALPNAHSHSASPYDITTTTVDVTSALTDVSISVNGAATPYEEAVTSFGTMSSDTASSTASSFSLPLTPVPPAPTTPPHSPPPPTSPVANGHAVGMPDSSVPRPDRLRPGSMDSDDDKDQDLTLIAKSIGVVVVVGDGEGVRVNGEVGGEGSEERDSVQVEGGGGEARDDPRTRRGIERASSIESGMHSFGLHSPDVVPTADVDFHNLDEGHSVPSDLYTAIYSPDVNMIPRQRLYIDPDIIDLTMFPVPDPSMVEEDSVIDFTALSSLPPSSFATPHHPPPSSSQHPDHTPSDLSNGFPASAGVGRAPGLMRSSSAGHCPQVFDSDIEALIAQYYVPPPPSSSSDDDNPSRVLSQSFSGAIRGQSNLAGAHPPASDDISSLIIPPPPAASSTHTEDEPAVPSVPRRGKERGHSGHKRSSSVDIGALRLAQQQLSEMSTTRSLDSQDLGGQTLGQDGPRAPIPPSDLQGLNDQHSDRHIAVAAESPASVSLKLHNLLKSLPSFHPEVSAEEQDEQQTHGFRRTGSLRIPRSASLDLVPGSPAGQSGGSEGSGGDGGVTGKASRRTLFSGSASMGRAAGRRTVAQQPPSLPVVSAGPAKDPEKTQPPTPSENFASLKAKLKDYRDQLLRRASLSRKHSSDPDLTERSSLKRSNSFSRLLGQLGRRRGSGSSDPGVGLGVEEDRGREGAGGRESSSTGDLQQSPGTPPAGEDGRRPGTPAVREHLVVARSSLRPVSTAGVVQKSKKSGPLKALSSVLAGEEKLSENGFDEDALPPTTTTTTTTTSPPPSQLSRLRKARQQQYGSKDDLSVLTPEEQRKKKNKVQANPYATIKMWRPITMNSSVSHEDDAYRNFNNFDVLLAEARLPATGDLRNDSFHRDAEAASGSLGTVTASGGDSFTGFTGNGLPSDDHNPHVDASLQTVRNGEADTAAEAVRTGRDFRKLGANPGRSGSRDVGGGVSVKRAESLSLPSSAVTIPLRPRTLTLEEQQEQARTLVPPPRRSRQVSRSAALSDSSHINGGSELPEDYPLDSSSSSSHSSRGSRSLSRDGQRVRQRSPDRKGRSVMDSSHDVVSAEVSKSVKSVLSKTYGPEGFEAAAQDVETLLVHLKVTMETLKTAQVVVRSSSSQFQTARQELQLQTKQFVQDAKSLVAGATGSHQAVSTHLHGAMHTLARLLLHSQAVMIRMRSVHQAQHVGFEVLKVSAAFRSTVSAANLAMGRATVDPQMKYLMRQATNLAGLLSTLLKTLKNLEQSS
ncbi:uncharacterized protein LOC143284028 isoform X2 [Babylonia areolata]|uniref:uncharacterized protein LOC143284028 isoform X2 n=1 Tax=Babylonia areolata TaxID=304850 RepID=UPI003FD1C3FE